LKWTKVWGSTGYGIRGRKVGTTNWVTLTVGGANNTSKNVGGLAPGTSYEWQVKAYCNASGSISSPYTMLDTFTTNSSPTRLANPWNVKTNAMTVIPNPVQEQATVRLNLDDETPVALQVLDITGKTVLTLSTIESNEVQLDGRDLSSGIYVVELRTDAGIYREKVMVE